MSGHSRIVIFVSPILLIMYSSLANEVDFIAIDLIPFELRQMLVLVQVAKLFVVDSVHIGSGIVAHVRTQFDIRLVLGTVCIARVVDLRLGFVGRVLEHLSCTVAQFFGVDSNACVLFVHLWL